MTLSPLGSKRKLIYEDAKVTKKVRTSFRQMITPSAMTDIPISSLPSSLVGPSPFAASSITSAPSDQLVSEAPMPARLSPCATSVLELAKTVHSPMIFAPATMPDDHALTTNALRGA